MAVHTRRSIIRYRGGESKEEMDTLICEQWLDLYVNDVLLVEVPVSWQEIEELVHGFLLMEGYIRSGERVELEERNKGIYCTVASEVRPRRIKELVDCASSKIELEEDIVPVEGGEGRSIGELLQLARDFQSLPSLYHKTGSVHMAAYAEKEILYSADDISRRNAVDKAVGKAHLAGRRFSEAVLLTSGRISSDVVLRMIRVGIPILVSKSAPMDKAVDLAEAYGITVCGFARGKRVNIYSHAERIRLQ